MSSDDLGFVVVTHPFYPLIGQRLEVLYVKRRAGDTVFVCSGGVGGAVGASSVGPINAAGAAGAGP